MMKPIQLIALLTFAVLSACKTSAPIIESSYEAAAIDVQLDRLTNQLVKSLNEERKSKIAIMEFPDLQGNVSELGKFIPEELTTRLFMTRRFEVVERSLLNKVLEEQNLGMTGLVDVSSAAQIGKMLGVEAIVTGTITDMGHALRINARVIATETAGVFAVSSVSIDKDAHLVSMMNRVSTQPVQPSADVSSDSDPGQVDFKFPEIRTEDVNFEIVAAVVTNNHKAIIDIMITNVHHLDKEVGINRASTLYDNMGQQYHNPVRSIGSKTHRGITALRHLFISNVSTRLRLEFDEIDPDAESFPLLVLSLWNLPDVTLRSIPFERQ